MERVQNTKLVLWLILGVAAAVGVARFAWGLGATTNLTDATPWGIWIGFDVMAGVALAAGGFVMTAIVYIMRREEYHDLVKPAVLTAFLGYLAVIFGLLFDLGLPWNIWHMMIFWNPHSPLFEVGWCVMLYTTVLLLEFSPVPLQEASRYAKIRSFLMKFRFPLVLLGIMLSTLHQSSLGSLFLIMPFKLHPLWYSSILPIQFFISAAALGLMMVAFESLASHWLYKRKAENNLVAKLGSIAVWVLLAYLIVRIGDIFLAGEIAMIFDGSFESGLFIAEILISAIVPIAIFATPSLRNNPRFQWVGSAMVVFGMVFNRINVGGVTMQWATGDAYIPAWTEIFISAGVVSAAALAFLFAVEHFSIWDKRPVNPESERHALPRFDRASQVWLGNPLTAASTKYSLAFVIAFAIGVALIPGKKLRSEGIEQVPARSASGYEMMLVDGNRDGFGVNFPHAKHIEMTGGKENCQTCHHMNLPYAQQSGCWECHSSMYDATDIFDHDWHGSAGGGNVPCAQCHATGEEKLAATAKTCDQCHSNIVADGPQVIENYMAMSYTDAMHVKCVNCHRQKATELVELPDLAQCNSCHETLPAEYTDPNGADRAYRRHYNRVVLPPAADVQ